MRVPNVPHTLFVSVATVRTRVLDARPEAGSVKSVRTLIGTLAALLNDVVPAAEAAVPFTVSAPLTGQLAVNLDGRRAACGVADLVDAGQLVAVAAGCKT